MLREYLQRMTLKTFIDNFRNKTQIFIIGRETWSWGNGYCVHWRIIDSDGVIYEIESNGQMQLTTADPRKWFSKLNIRVIGSSKCNNLRELLCTISINQNTELRNRNYLGSANSVIYMIKDTTILLLECHGSHYCTKCHDNSVNIFVSKIYKIIGFSDVF